ncbi:AEC family transporter [Alkalihalophilus marmarensis]|uniref:Transporter n=1 Tax=Alkalihalophilus marmarensis DSM 21297 TaxID=1188261 RepID=U6SR39_9BACI|nr:AEC family transporter [Alkalihalophilus marmarensis]ERN53126.1 transporter [Alkalihalophilus marmarensis DSM 21297]MCM3488938.1 AEC family transporter [Alkalihalophilus marmarensis]
MTIFIHVMLPVLLVFVLGFLIQKWKQVDIKPISTVAIYVMTPCLVFRTFYTSELNLQYVYMVTFAMALLFGLIFINKLYAKIRRLSTSEESGMILATAFMNSGNYGAPIILFAYGEAGFAYSVSFMVLQAIIMNFFGVYYAAKGKDGIKIAKKAVLAMPATYAVIIALLFNVLALEMPNPLILTIDMIAEATVPTVMLILGMQLALIKWGDFDWPNLSFGFLTRLFISPALAFLILLFLPVEPLLSKVLIVSAAMPSAATIVMYAVQFQAEPRLVSSITLMTTIGSVLTITGLLIWLG